MRILDTDIFIDFFRGVAHATDYILQYKGEIAFSAITEAELLSGNVCEKFQEREKVFHLLSQFEKIPVDNPLVQTAAELRRGIGLELPDAIIAATALTTDATLITRNIKDFQKIKGLKIEKPY